MKRNWNWRLWAGFALVLVGAASYQYLFIRFAVTRDFPWANLILFALAAYLLVTGLRRAFQQPEAYRGKVSGTILTSLSALVVGLFLFVVFYMARQVPASRGAPAVGQVAPDFTLADQNGQPVTLSALLRSPFSTNDWPAVGEPRGNTAGSVLIFYRGYW